MSSIHISEKITLTINFKPKIYIVESDIEALNIWKNISNTIILSHKTKTLISVNSHCNDGLYMKWKTNITNVINVSDVLTKLVSMPLQTIYPAVAGLFRKIMCIYPWWRHSSDIFMHNFNYLGVKDQSLCLCTLDNNATVFNESSCRIVDSGPETLVSVSECMSLSHEWETIAMQEIYAQTEVKDCSTTDNAMLSINLDFFTADKDEALLDRDIIDILERQIGAILCPASVQDEALVDAWFQSWLTGLAKTLNEHILLLNTYKEIKCPGKTASINAHLKSLLTTLHNLSAIQRNQLSRTGLCLPSLSSGHGQRNSLSPVLCSGLLHIENSGLSHTATHNEITLQMEKLTHFLKQSLKKPQLIAIVRSTRLGLVSPGNQEILETLLLGHLQRLYNVNDTDVVYHDNLLGGVRGLSEQRRSTLRSFL